MGQINKALESRGKDASLTQQYTDTATKYYSDWQGLAFSSGRMSSGYDQSGSWALAYNLYPAMLMGAEFIGQDVRVPSLSTGSWILNIRFDRYTTDRRAFIILGCQAQVPISGLDMTAMRSTSSNLVSLLWSNPRTESTQLMTFPPYRLDNVHCSDCHGHCCPRRLHCRPP